MANLVLGVDYGSQNIRSCAFHGETFEVIYNTLKKASTPSSISFGNEIFVGERAIKVTKRNRATGHMRLLGRSWKELTDKNLLNENMVNVVEVNGYPEYSVSYRGENFSLKPEIIAAIILDDILNQVHSCIEASTRGVVISIPLNFNQVQRQAILDSANISGINVLQLVNETTAAAISYFQERRQTGKVLVYHMGAETFDFSVINLTEKGVSVLHSSDGYILGGDFINDLIYNWVCSNFDGRINNKNKDIIYEAIESAKIDLMFSSEISITDYSNIDIQLERHQFNSLIYSEVIDKTINAINSSLGEWGIPKTDINVILLIGGCCKMEILKQAIEDEFTSVSLVTTNDNIVSRGAAILGALIEKQLPDPFEVNEVIESSIVLNDTVVLQNEHIGIRLDTITDPIRKKLDIFTGNGSSYVSVNYTIDHNGIMNLEDATERANKDIETIDRLRKEKEYLTSQNSTMQEIKEALNSLRDMVESYESYIEDFAVPVKYKEIFKNLKKDVFRIKLHEEKDTDNIKWKEGCIRNYVSYLISNS